MLPGIGAASSLLLLQSAKREAIIRLLVWMAVGIVVYIFYGRTHSEINNPRHESMQVLHENFSVDTLNYQGYTDDDLRQQYARQLARRLDFDHPLTRRQSEYLEARLTREFDTIEMSRIAEECGIGRHHRSQGDDCASTSSEGGIDSGHGVGAQLDIRIKSRKDSSTVVSIHSEEPRTPSSDVSSRSFHQLQPSMKEIASRPESAYLPQRSPPHSPR